MCKQSLLETTHERSTKTVCHPLIFKVTSMQNMPAWNNFFINIINVFRKRNIPTMPVVITLVPTQDVTTKEINTEKCRLAADPARLYDVHIWYYIRIITIKSSTAIHGRLPYMDEFLQSDAHVRSHHTWYEAENRQAHKGTLRGSLAAKQSSEYIRVFASLIEYLFAYLFPERCKNPDFC